MWLAWIALCTAFLIPPTGTAPAPGSASEKVGKVEPRELGGHRIWIYTPPGYDEAAKTPYDLLIVFDGEQYVEDFALPKMLDALLAERAAPAFVTVMIDDGSGAVRLADLANRESFAAYLSAELLPYVRRQWTVTSNPRATVVSGSSAGELAAAFVAYRHP